MNPLFRVSDHVFVELCYMFWGWTWTPTCDYHISAEFGWWSKYTNTNCLFDLISCIIIEWRLQSKMTTLYYAFVLRWYSFKQSVPWKVMARVCSWPNNQIIVSRMFPTIAKFCISCNTSWSPLSPMKITIYNLVSACINYIIVPWGYWEQSATCRVQGSESNFSLLNCWCDVW